MNKPINIMDEIEERHWSDASEEEWQALRKAVEAQAEELEQAKRGWEKTSEYAKGCGETIAMLQAQIGRLEESHESLIDAIHLLIADKPVRDLDERLTRASIVRTKR